MGSIEHLKEEREQMLDYLAGLESGTVHVVGRLMDAGPVEDTTKSEIARLKAGIAELDSLIARQDDF